jgi:hypothetical protein
MEDFLKAGELYAICECWWKDIFVIVKSFRKLVLTL